MEKRGIILVVALIIFLVLITTASAIFVKEKPFTGKAITGEITGESVTGDATTQSIALNISVTSINNPPVIEYIHPKILKCEGQFLEYFFNATDIDDDALNVEIYPRAPTVPFRAMYFEAIEPTLDRFLIFTGILGKLDLKGSDVGNKTYSENVSVCDAQSCSSDFTNITIIEINHAPHIANIGVQTVETVWINGSNSTFYKQVIVTDAENGDYSSGNLTFNMTIVNSSGDYVNLFNISSTGLINYTPDFNEIGVYNISINATDLGLNNPHPNISNCNDTGGNKSTIADFSLTVTSANRPPEITDYYPLNLTFTISGSDSMFFNITFIDLDETIPDAYWYIDGFSYSNKTGSLHSELNFTWGCGVSGNHVVKAEVTDGLLNDSVEWYINVIPTECPASDGGEGGGGGGGGGGVGENITCIPAWFCDPWSQCMNLEEAYNQGLIDIEAKLDIKAQCSVFNWSIDTCGYQIRDCADANNCLEREIVKVRKPFKPIEGNLTKPEIDIFLEDVIYQTEMPEPTDGRGEEGCVPQFVCEEWSKCEIDYDLQYFSKKDIVMKGEQKRRCKDLNECKYDRLEERICETRIPILAKDFEDYIEVYDKENENLISRIEISGRRVSIQIPLDGKDYQPHCYDDIKNYDEDEVDCNYAESSCPACITGLPTIRGDYMMMLIILIVLIAGCFLLGGWYLYLGKKIKQSMSHILKISRRGNSNVSKKTLNFSKQRILAFLTILGISLFFLFYVNYSINITGKAIGGLGFNKTIEEAINGTKPPTVRGCYFTLFPDCEDNIQNCHHGDCEELVDCGGPCEPCPETCSDGIRNQGEFGTDCGGPCRPCFREMPALAIGRSLMYIFLIIIILILVLILRLVSKNYDLKKKRKRFWGMFVKHKKEEKKEKEAKRKKRIAKVGY